jgi:acyl-coenzyme A synthetase/AMP-(fatty) acid ligase
MRHVIFASFAASLALVAFAALGACSHTGLGGAVRSDITARMQTAQDPIAACYAEQLKENRKLKGTMVLSATAAATTGQFEQVKITRDDLADAKLGKCVVDEVSKLKLAEPTKSPVQFEYPLAFAPTK